MIAASKVIRVKECVIVEHATRDAEVVLKLTCRMNGKIVRLEVPLCSYSVEEVVQQLRNGVNYHVNRWQKTSAAVGS